MKLVANSVANSVVGSACGLVGCVQRTVRGLAAALVLVAGTAGGLVALGGFTPSAQAQPGMGRMMAAQFSNSGSAISRKSLSEYATLLGMSEEQKETATTLLEGYRDAHKAALEEMQAKVEGLQEKARDTGDWSVFQKDMPEIGKTFAEKVDKLEKDLVTDIQAVLTPAQVEKWPSVERHRRRDMGLRWGFYSGAAVDLIRITNRSGITMESPEAKEVLGQYETELDAKLQEFGRWSDDSRKEAMKPENMMNQQSQMKLLEEGAKYSKDVRDINKRYVSRLRDVLDETNREKFTEEFNKRAYPRIYRDSHTEEMLIAATGFSDLDESQKETVKTLKEQYMREASSLNTNWAKAQEAAEEKAGGSMQLMMAQWMGASEDVKKAQEEIKAAREARKEVDDKFKKRLQDMLNGAQKDRLPTKKPTNQNPWDFGMFVEEEGEDE
jgi:hypothetical protein